jgi:hypothetical protein
MVDFDEEEVIACGKEAFNFAKNFAHAYPIGNIPLESHCEQNTYYHMWTDSSLTFFYSDPI